MNHPTATYVFAGVNGRLLQKVASSVDAPTFCSSILLDAATGETVEEPGYGDDAGHPDAYLRAVNDVARFDWRTGDSLRIADVVTAMGKDHELCSRSILRRVLRELDSRNIKILIGLELEVFILPRRIAHLGAMGRFRPGVEHRSYSERVSDPRIVRFLSDVERAVSAAGVDAAYASREYAPFQYEFTLGPSDPLRCADDLLLLRQILLECARLHDLYACFLPQPFEDGFGSGLHVNITATAAGEPVFLADDPDGLSSDIFAFANSLETHLQACCAIWNPTVNSYRRLGNVEFSKTSAFVLANRRDSLLRVTRPPGNRAARLEFRVPDCMLNPYAGLAICLGLLERSIGQVVERPGERYRLPESLDAAVSAFEADKTLTEILGTRWSNVYRKVKLEELAWHSRRVELGDYVLSAPDIAADLFEELLPPTQ